MVTHATRRLTSIRSSIQFECKEKESQAVVASSLQKASPQRTMVKFEVDNSGGDEASARFKTALET